MSLYTQSACFQVETGAFNHENSRSKCPDCFFKDYLFSYTLQVSSVPLLFTVTTIFSLP